MPSRRMIDPAFWQSESMAELTREQRFFFIGLISNADDQGRLKGPPALLRSIIYPYDDDMTIEMIETSLKAIAALNSIFMYENGGKRFIQVVNWWDYQSPQWAYPSKIPPPEGWSDRLRYRKGGEIVKENWKKRGSGFEDDSNDDYPNLGKDLPKAQGKDLGGPVVLELESELELELDIDIDIKDSTPKGETPVSKTKKPLTETQKLSQQYFAVIVKECQWDCALLTPQQRGKANQTEALFRTKTSYTPADIEGFYETTWLPHRPYKYRGVETPDPKHIRELIKVHVDRKREQAHFQTTEADLPQPEHDPAKDFIAGLVADGQSKESYWFHGITFIDQPNGIARLGLSDAARDWLENRLTTNGRKARAIEYVKDHNPTLTGIEFVEAT